MTAPPPGVKPVVVVCEDHAHAPPYVDALTAVGIPGEGIRLLTPEDPRQDYPRLGAEAAGVLLCGGPDMEPRRFGEEPLAEAGLALLPALDEIELQVLAGAREGATPVFGICRGLQTLNVYFGGSLWQDLALQVPGSADHRLSYPRDALIHPVRVTAEASRLGELLCRETALVNSRHHQGVKALGRELEVVAVAPDGLVEAVARPADGWWVQAVQWHPENLLALALQRQLFSAFAAACGGSPARPPG